MKIVYNNILPPSGFKAINICGVLFVRKGKTLSDVDMNHEKIHSKQIFEMAVVPFYIWYGVEYLARYLSNKSNAYRSIGFESEAYSNEANINYLNTRKPYAWLKYLKL